ncbi:MAG: radical SAM protein [Acidobacteriota bacterium]
MRYVEPVFRPPSEAESLILQVTVGCSHNACTFCAMYRNKAYRVRDLAEIREEVREAAADWPDCPRVFLGDGDALAAPTELLVEVLGELRTAFPRLRRTSLYATPMNLLDKAGSELQVLREAGLDLFYLGMESGSDDVLRTVGKGATAEEIVDAVRKGRAAGLAASVMVLLGLGGVEGSEAHARASAEVVSLMQPEYLSALTWYPVPEAPLFRKLAAGRFSLPDDLGILRELEILLRHSELRDTVFRANHASNPLPIGGRLSRDRDRLLAAVAAARAGIVPLRPSFLRGT